MEKIVVYPGTFDPITNGHVSLVRRAVKIFDQVVVAIAYHSPKKTLFSLEERFQLANEVFAQEPKVKVETFKGLLIDYVKSKKAVAILRGLRAVSDFEYEFQLALMNRKLSLDIQTVFLMTDYKWLYISSTIIKEVASLGGDVSGLVPECVLDALRQKYER